MSNVDYKASSPYRDTPQTIWYLGNYEHRDIPQDITDTPRIIEGKFQYRPDLLSFELYGTPNFWWIFMVLNPDQLKDPIYDLKAGMIIMVPTQARLFNLMGV